MVIAKLQGGLGNQMFQYAAARAISGEAETIWLDLSFINANQQGSDSFTARHYQLDIFKNLRVRFIGEGLSKIIKSDKKLQRGLRKLLLPGLRYINDESKSYIRKGNFYLDGYFQNETGIKHVRDSLLNEFAFPPTKAQTQQIKTLIEETPNSVAVHIRRGDYLKASVAAYHGVLPMSYYTKATLKIEETIDNPTYFVFSDDIGWCRQNVSLGNASTVFIDTNSAYWTDMALMTTCQHHIIANSTYSWWGAWLNPCPKKVVIAPQRWFADPAQQRLAASLIPEDWITL